jgi:hypothetical protein
LQIFVLILLKFMTGIGSWHPGFQTPSFAGGNM